MKRYLACAALTCLLLPGCGHEKGKPSATDIFARVRPSVVKLNVVDSTNRQSSGSGVFLTADGQILTCYHVISGAKTVVAHLADGSTAKVTGVVAASQAQDWAVVQSDARNAVPAPRGKASALRQGDRIYTLGAPLGLDLTASDGMVSSIRNVQRVGLYLQITAPISPGSSGSPVLNADGEVVGIAASALAEGENLNFAVAISNVEAQWKGTESPRQFAAVSAAVKGAAGANPPLSDSEVVGRLFAQGVAALPDVDASENVKSAAFRHALLWFERANRLLPNDVDILFELAYCHAGLREFDEAIAGYRQALRMKPGDEDTHFNLGVALRGAGRTNEAIAEYRQAIRIKPEDAEVHNNLGVALGLVHHNEEAIAEYRTAISIRADYAEAHSNLGLALGKAGRNDEEISEYRTAIRIRPNYAYAHANLGAALGEAGKDAEAIEEYKTAIRLKQDLADVHFSLGWVYARKGDRASALREYDTLRGLNQTKAKALMEFINIARHKPKSLLQKDLAAAHINRGVELGSKGRTNEAIEEFRTGIRLDPNEVDAHDDLGLALYRNGETDAAIAEFRIAVRLKPTDADVHRNLGVALVNKHEDDQAIAELRTAIRLEPELAPAHFALGLVYLMKGDKDSALKEYDTLKGLDAGLAKQLSDSINSKQ